MSAEMKILHVIGRMGRGGIQTWLMNVLRYIDRDRYHFDFLPQMPGPHPHDAEVRQLGAGVLPAVASGNPLAFRRRLMQVYENEGPYDVVHAHGDIVTGFVLRYAAKVGIPVRIAHSHNLGFAGGASKRFRSRFFSPFTRRWMHKYLTVGLGCSRRAVAALFGPDWQEDTRLGVIHYGLDFSPLRASAPSRMAARKAWGIAPEAPVVGHVGRFYEQKNHPFLLRVAKEVLAQFPEARFLLVGDGPLRSHIEGEIRQLGLQDQFILTGLQADVAPLMHAMDVFALPSLHEGLGIVLWEAQAAGLRCVMSEEVPGEAIVVDEHVRQIPLSAGPAVWSEAICQYLRAPRSCTEEACNDRVSGRYGIEQSLAKLVQVYETGRPPAQDP